MPRRRFRDPDPSRRDRNRWEIAGNPGVAGLGRIGGASRTGGGTTLVTRGAAGAGTQIEHVTLSAQASQTIASGGAGVTWDQVAGAPTEVRGFDTLMQELNSTGEVVAIPCDVTGFILIGAELEFGATVDVDSFKVQRVRGQNVTTFVEIVDTNLVGISGHKGGWVRAGDEVKLTLDPAASVDVSGTVELEIWSLAAITSSFARYRQVVLADGPLAYWELNETSGTTAADSSGNGWDLTYAGGVTLGQTGLMLDGSDATSVHFDGSTGRAVGGDWSEFEFAGAGQTFTVEAWASLDVSGGNNSQVIVHKQDGGSGNGWELVYDRTNDRIVWNVTGVGGPVYASPAKETTYHLVGVVDGTDAILYVNGAEVDRVAAAGTLSASTATVSIGYDTVSGWDSFAGDIDEVAVYARALTSSEIAEHYQVGTQEAA